MRRLLDVVWDERLIGEIDKLLAQFRLMPGTPDDGLHTIMDAVRLEKQLRAGFIKHLLVLIEGSRVECHDLELADALGGLKAAWDRLQTDGTGGAAWTTPARLCKEFDLSSSAMTRRLDHAECPQYESVRGESGRIVKLRLNAELREWLARAKQPGKLLLAEVAE